MVRQLCGSIDKIEGQDAMAQDARDKFGMAPSHECQAGSLIFSQVMTEERAHAALNCGMWS